MALTPKVPPSTFTTRQQKALEDWMALIAFPSYAKASLPSATTAGRIIYVTNETGGAVLAFSDGTNWRRVTDRAIVS